MKFEDMHLEACINTRQIMIGDATEVEIRDYLPINEKVDLIEYVVNSAIDYATGLFSPVRVEVYFSIAVCKWYAGIEFDEEMNVPEVYDILETNGVLDKIMAAVPESELDFMRDLMNETIQDMARFNSSAAGIIQNMSKNTDILNGQFDEVMAKIKNKEGIETLTEIKDALSGKVVPMVVKRS